MSEKKDLLAALCRTELGAGNIDFRLTLSSLATSALGKNRSDADAFADTNIKKYWNWLKKEVDAHATRGLTPFFSLASGGAYSISSACHALVSSQNVDHQLRGTLALSRPSVLRQIDAMTDREYEALACVACSAIGSHKTHLTPPGGEGGIDFFATLSINTRTHVLSAAGTEIRIVGQCKKYASPVPVEKIDQFITTMEYVRHRNKRVADHIPAWFDESRGPILGWVMSHSGFQTGAADTAKNQGIVLSDTLDLAELVCLSDTFHASLLPPARAVELIEACRRLI